MIAWDRIEELRREIGAAEFEEIVNLFLEEVDGVMAGLGNDGDAARLAADLHFIKGSALNLGFEALSDECHLQERQLASGVAAAECRDLGGLSAIYAQSRQALLEGLVHRG